MSNLSEPFCTCIIIMKRSAKRWVFLTGSIFSSYLLLQTEKKWVKPLVFIYVFVLLLTTKTSTKIILNLKLKLGAKFILVLTWIVM